MIKWIVIPLLFVICIADARVIGIDHYQRLTVMADKEFGASGPYEYLSGIITFGLDPALSANQLVCDLDLAPRDTRSLVLSKSKFIVLQAQNPSKRNGVALIEVSNRGGKSLMRYYNGAGTGQVRPNVPGDMGDEYLLKQGYTLVWIGWEWDVPEENNLLRLEVPVLKNPDGSSITGLVRTDWVIEQEIETLSLGHRNLTAYPAADFEHPGNILTVRRSPEAYKSIISRDKWSFSVIRDGKPVKDSFHITVKNGFKPGNIYELVYQAQNPVNVGLGLTAIRDLASFIKYDPACPFRSQCTLAQGISQTGRFLRHFLYEGFNHDEAGRVAIDGMLIFMAGAGRGSFNHRFAQPSRDAHRYSSFDFPTDLPPFDHINHYPADGTKIMFINSGYEYWGRAASLTHINKEGTDIAVEDNERYYHISSMQHYTESMPDSSRKIFAQYDIFKGNPLHPYPIYKALLHQMTEWLLKKTLPLENQIPRITEHNITDRFNFKFPYIPGLDLPISPYEPNALYFGPRWAATSIIDQEPPMKISTFHTMIPTVDAYGNETGGIKSIELRVPLATYTPWSQRYGYKNNRELDDFRGLFIPLPSSKSNFTTRDMRPDLESLYPEKSYYLNRVEVELARMVQERILLPEDMDAQKKLSSNLWDWVAKYHRIEK